MPTPDQIRIAHDRARPRLMELWWALRPLTSVVRFMQTGAHPDDEISGLLAALTFRDGLNLSYACSTRGEGGQNDIGTEAGPELGALRTREMERACDVLGMRMYWHGTHSKDPITDFGFSKSGQETLDRWGYDRTLQRFVEIVRRDRPDVMCPTFLDVPGQHGHHRAMTQAAHDVMSAAADPEFDCDLPPWQVKKLYLPAWSGAGQAYDDDLPPPPATLRVLGTDREPMSGWTWNRIGQQSRTYHRTQGMGRWVPAGAGQDWPLHLAETHVAGPDTEIWSGIPYNLVDLAALPEAGAAGGALTAAHQCIAAAVAAFPDFQEVATAAMNAVQHLKEAEAACPSGFTKDHGHRLAAKHDQLAQVVRLALGAEARVRPATVFAEPNSAIDLIREVDSGLAQDARTRLDLPKGWTEVDGGISIGPDASPSDPYRAHYDPIAPTKPNVQLSLTVDGMTVTAPVAFETDPVILPRNRVTLSPSASMVNTATERRTVTLQVSDLSPAGVPLELSLPKGWRAERDQAGFVVTAPPDVAPGQYKIAAFVDGAPAHSARLIAHDHVAPTAFAPEAEVTIGVSDISLPQAKVGYIGAGNDRVGEWLAEIGVDVTDLSPDDIQTAAILDNFDTVVVGIFAMRFRPGLAASMPALHRWTEAGGTLVTLYHRPWDNWDPDNTPPRRLEIGMPSLRWRVTDEAAKVTHLADHALLNSPNAIDAKDWEGWVKERGLYFAKSWDADYEPLLSMADPGEAPLTGALLVADIGLGRHVHTSLILHHQMENLVPGAFRLMANLLAPRA